MKPEIIESVCPNLNQPIRIRYFEPKFITSSCLPRWRLGALLHWRYRATFALLRWRYRATFVLLRWRYRATYALCVDVTEPSENRSMLQAQRQNSEEWIILEYRVRDCPEKGKEQVMWDNETSRYVRTWSTKKELWGLLIAFLVLEMFWEFPNRLAVSPTISKYISNHWYWHYDF